MVYVYGPFDRVWAEEHPLIFSGIKEYMFIYLQTYHEKHWILRVFYRIFWISIFNTYSYGELFTGVSPIVGIHSTYSRYNQIMDCARSRHHAPLAVDWPLSATPPPFSDKINKGGAYIRYGDAFPLQGAAPAVQRSWERDAILKSRVVEDDASPAVNPPPLPNANFNYQNHCQCQGHSFHL